MRPLCMLYPISHELWCFPVWLVGISTICGTEWAPYRWFFTWSSIISSNACAGKLSEKCFQEHFWTFGGFFLSEKFSPLWFFVLQTPAVWTSLLTSSLQLPVPSAPLSKIIAFCFGSPPALQPENSLQVLNWDNCWSHLLCFPSLRDHCPSLSHA